MKIKTLCTALALGTVFAALPLVSTSFAQGSKQERKDDRAKYRECRDVAKEQGLRGYKRFLSIETCMRGR